jgi:hypothetical protein
MDPTTGPTMDPAAPSDPANPYENAAITPATRLTVSGSVEDFETGTALAGSVAISTTGVLPPPTVEVTGATFTVQGIPPASVFYVLASSPPDYVATYNVPVSVVTSDVGDVHALALRSTYVSGLAATFNVTPKAGTGIIIGQLVDAAGAPKQGMPLAGIQVNGAAQARSPFFLDGQKKPQAGLNATSASGYFVIFDVPQGIASVAGPVGSTIGAAAAPVGTGLVTLIDLVVSPTPAGGTPAPLMNVSLSKNVVPIFSKRGCVVCHSAGGIGRDLGGLTLTGTGSQVYRQLMNESPNFDTPRVDVKDPPKSLVLTMPGYENPPDPHPNVIFASTTDVDYQTILTWIKEGAKNN